MGVALKELHDDPDRLRAPLVKRDGRFVETTWDEAFAEIERRLVPLIEQHGRDAVAVALGNPVAHKMGLLLYGPRLIPRARHAEHLLGFHAGPDAQANCRPG